MDETNKKEQPSSTHKIGIYLWIWGLLFVLSFFSYLVDWYQFQGHAEMVSNIVFYVFKSWSDNGFLYALVLGKICSS